jgi:hypothetical protein
VVFYDFPLEFGGEILAAFGKLPVTQMFQNETTILPLLRRTGL